MLCINPRFKQDMCTKRVQNVEICRALRKKNSGCEMFGNRCLVTVEITDFINVLFSASFYSTF